MVRSFIPDGYFTFAAACEEAARLSFGSDLAVDLSPAESAELARYAQSHLRKYPKDANPADSGLAPVAITALLKQRKRRHKQRSHSLDTMCQRLFANTIKSWVLSSDGQLELIPSRIWASKSFTSILETGRLHLTVSDSYVDRSVEGPVLLRSADIAQLFRPKGSEAVDHGSVAAAAPLRHAGGSPPKFDWHDIWAEICRIVVDEGFPESRAELARKVQTWHRGRYGYEPSDEILKPKIRMLFSRLKLDSRE